jgi:hypothetical protein
MLSLAKKKWRPTAITQPKVNYPHDVATPLYFLFSGGSGNIYVTINRKIHRNYKTIIASNIAISTAKMFATMKMTTFHFVFHFLNVDIIVHEKAYFTNI